MDVDVSTWERTPSGLLYFGAIALNHLLDLKTWNCKMKGCIKCYYFLRWPNRNHVLFCHQSHQSACFTDEAEGRLISCLGGSVTSFVSGWNPEPDVNVSQTNYKLLLHFPLCLNCDWSKVIILNFISCGLLLELQDNLDMFFSHFIMLWLNTFYILASLFVVQLYPVKNNKCLKRYLLFVSFLPEWSFRSRTKRKKLANAEI